MLPIFFRLSKVVLKSLWVENEKSTFNLDGVLLHAETVDVESESGKLGALMDAFAECCNCLASY